MLLLNKQVHKINAFKFYNVTIDLAHLMILI